MNRKKLLAILGSWFLQGLQGVSADRKLHTKR